MVERQVQKMCNGCYFNIQDGSCSIPWISTQEQIIRAAVGQCEDAAITASGGGYINQLRIKIEGKWIFI